MIDGRLLWADEDRLVLLALLLENVGALRAVQLGDPQVWRDAVNALHPGPAWPQRRLSDYAPAAHLARSAPSCRPPL